MTGRDAARQYHERGWHPFPLPAGTKSPPPAGRTGYGGIDLSPEEIDAAEWSGNVAVRMSVDVLGLDVDAYRGGLVTLRTLEERLGALPGTWMSHSGRNDGSGIRYYRVPAWMGWVHALPGIEIVQRDHRYGMVWPSTHPEGRRYGWLDQRDLFEPVDGVIPAVEELAELPWPWIEELGRVPGDPSLRPASRDAVAAFLAEHTQADEPGYLDRVVVAAFDTEVEAGRSRHDSMMHKLNWAMELARAQVLSADVAVEELQRRWDSAMQREPRREDAREFPSMLASAVAKAGTKTDADLSKLHDGIAGISVGSTPAVVPRAALQLDPAALHGILGDAVRVIGPHSEACDAALLVTLAVSVGNYIGREPHVMVEADRHGTSLYGVLVGDSARGRKGIAAGRVAALMELVDMGNLWSTDSIASGFGSGEGVLATLDNGARKDERLLVDEREFASLLTVASRDGTILSSVLRNGWDGQPLRHRVKNGKLQATDYHLSALGHITELELQRRLTSTEQSNGFANRFLWVHTERARRLPHGGSLDPAAFSQLGQRLKRAVEAARKIGRVTMTDAARPRWEGIYDAIADAELPGIVAALTNRAEAQTLRLSLLYAVLDGSPQIDVEHLEAGWALWRYCEASVLHVWSEVTGDRDVDRLVDAVREAMPGGLSTTDAYERVFAKHKAVAPIAARAVRYGLLRIDKQVTAGRAREVLLAV